MAGSTLTVQGRKAVDTNIVVRLILRDDAAQIAIVRDLLRDPLFVPATVLLETVWVLSSRYEMTRAEIAGELEDLLDLPTVHVDRPDRIRWAIDRFRAGADFADVLHVVMAEDEEALLTFDRSLARLAGSEAPTTIVTLKA